MLVGRIVGRDATSIVIEITLDHELAWDPGSARCVAIDAHGVEHPAGIDPARTTRAGAYAAGLVVRLALAVPAGSPTPDVVRVELPGAVAPLYIALGG